MFTLKKIYCNIYAVMKLKEYDIYIFDFDGTLSDTIPGVKNSEKNALTLFGIHEYNDKKQVIIK